MTLKDHFKNALLVGMAGAAFWASSHLGTLLFRSISGYFERIQRYEEMSYNQVIADVDTVEEAEWYVRNYILPYERNRTDSFRLIHQNRSGDCSEAVVAAAALLSDDGFPPTYLAMFDKDNENGHGVFVYQQNGKWGTIGINSSDNYPPTFSSLDGIVRRLGYQVYYFGTVGENGIIPDWISTGRDLVFTPEENARLNLKYERILN